MDRKQDIEEDTEEELNRVLQSICPNGITLTDANYLNSSFLFSANLWEGLIPCVISSKGYKINMVKPATLVNTGTTLNPNTILNLFANQENWLGYFLSESVQPFNAIPAQIHDQIFEIKTEYWSMHRTNNPDEPWLFTKTKKSAKIAFNYGDMVSIVPSKDVSFKWQNTKPEEYYKRPEPKIFTFEPEANYTPIYVEFDPGNLPGEAAVFVNGVCKGASVVEGSITEINAYFKKEDLGQEIAFNFAYDNTSKLIVHTDYSIIDEQGSSTNSGLLNNSGTRNFHVSFAPEVNNNVQLNYTYSQDKSHLPIIGYSQNKDSNVNLEIYNMKGQKVKSLYQGSNTAGKHELVWNGKDNNNKTVRSGIYLYCLTSDKKVVQKKMLLINEK